MTSDAILAALDLPAGSRVDQRVPKKLLLEHGAPTAADKRHINEGIEELTWLAALKPTTIGVPEYRDGTREYLEIAVLRLVLRAAAKPGRLVELVHRAVPYPVLLLTDHKGQPGISGAQKRWSQGEAGKTVLEGDVVAVESERGKDTEHWSAFLNALAFGRQSAATLYGLYEGWLNTILALQAARVTGHFAVFTTGDRAAARRDALAVSAKLEVEISRLRAAAAKEKQMARRVELNLELKHVEAAKAAARGKL